MTTEFDRRSRLMDKCLDLANVAIEQQDRETAALMLRKTLHLMGVQACAMDLMQPGYIDSLKDNPAWVSLAQVLAEVDRDGQ